MKQTANQGGRDTGWNREYSQAPATMVCSFSAKLLSFQSTIIISLLHSGTTGRVSGLTDMEGT